MTWIQEKEKLGKEITELLYQTGMIKTWFRDKPEGWILHSGLWSPFYINLRDLGSYPHVFKKVCYAMGKLVKQECPSVNRVVGIATAGVPIAAGVALESGLSMGYTRKIEGVNTIEDFRKKISEYGQHTSVEGIYENGDDVILVDDLVTMLTSKLIAIEQFQEEMKNRKLNATCNKILVLLDREQGAQKMAQEKGLTLLALIPFKSKAISWLKDKFSETEFSVIKDYLDNSNKYQTKEIQQELRNKSKK